VVELTGAYLDPSPEGLQTKDHEYWSWVFKNGGVEEYHSTDPVKL
jgi:hypothetical protein